MIPTLILTAHGSADPRAATVTHAVAGRIRRLRPDLAVRVAFCEKHGPNLAEVLSGLDGPAVVTPLLLADAYHARVDIPAMIAASGATGVRQAPVLGADPALLAVFRQRLTETGVSRHDGDVGVIVAAVGSSDPAANAVTARVAATLGAGTHWAGATLGLATRPHPSLADAALRLRAAGATRLVIAPWFLAPGVITDRVAEYARAHQIPMTEPLGSHNLVAATVLDRYEMTVSGTLAA
ncbi:sirohydrochlorin chelatase [Mycolicibacterium insubricum]|nr:sirohydrochlorin chelatase [Mycolicibacterium insubricum]